MNAPTDQTPASPPEPALDLDAIRSRNERAMSTKMTATVDELLMLHGRDIPALLARVAVLEADNGKLREAARKALDLINRVNHSRDNVGDAIHILAAALSGAETPEQEGTK